MASIESCELPENSLATTIPPDFTPPQETTTPWVNAVPHRHIPIASMDGNSDQAPLVPEPDIASINMIGPHVRVAKMDATDPCDGGDATSPQPYVASIDRSHYSVQRQVLIASMDMQDSQDVAETASPDPYVASVDMDISVNPNTHIGSMDTGDRHRAASARPHIADIDMSTSVQPNVLIASMDDGDSRNDRHHDGLLHEVYSHAPNGHNHMWPVLIWTLHIDHKY